MCVDGTKGRYIWIQMPLGYLTLCEVEVYVKGYKSHYLFISMIILYMWVGG